MLFSTDSRLLHKLSDSANSLTLPRLPTPSAQPHTTTTRPCPATPRPCPSPPPRYRIHPSSHSSHGGQGLGCSLLGNHGGEGRGKEEMLELFSILVKGEKVLTVRGWGVGMGKFVVMFLRERKGGRGGNSYMSMGVKWA